MILKNNNNEKVYLLILFFILSFFYFLFFGDFVLYFQEHQSLFIISKEYLRNFFITPGGLLELAGKFISQLYINTVLGAFVLSLILILPVILLLKINKYLFYQQSFTLLFALIPSCLLLLLQIHRYHQLEYNIGFLIVLLYLLYAIQPAFKKYRYIVIAVFPVVYYVIGAYIWIFLIMYIIYTFIHGTGKRKYLIPAYICILTGLSIIVFESLLFFQPLNKLVLHPLPIIKDTKYLIILYILIVYLAVYPLLSKIQFLYKIKNKKTVSLVSVIFVFLLTVFLMTRIFNPQIRLAFRIQKYVLNNKWEEAIKLQEKSKSNNLLGKYFYNIALAETGQLSDRLFKGKQDFGIQALFFPWDQKYLTRGEYFYYSIGLLNEAHHWAYESMVAYGYQPENIKLLAKINLINGNYPIAEKYINLLKKSPNYRKLARIYEQMLHNPENIRLNPEFEEKLNLIPKENFFIDILPQNNLLAILKSNTNNKKAFEYKIAWFLLTKNIDALNESINELKKIGYTKIPLHIEEAILVYAEVSKNFPDLQGYSIRMETLDRFTQYVNDYQLFRNNPLQLKNNMNLKFSDTFWYYYHFFPSQ